MLARDVSTSLASISAPNLSRVDLVRTQGFETHRKVRPRKRRRGDEWRKLIIDASPYNRVSLRLTIPLPHITYKYVLGL